jgi:WD40 repeat protein
LKEENALYIFDKNKKVFEKLSDSVKNFAFSPDSKKLAYSNDYEIWVLFLDKNQEQPQREKGDKLFLTRFSEKIDDVFWWTNYYLILNEKDKIKIVEIDDRDKTNIAELASFPSLSKIFWNKDEKKVYVLDKNILYVSNRLIPLY